MAPEKKPGKLRGIFLSHFVIILSRTKCHTSAKALWPKIERCAPRAELPSLPDLTC